MNAFYYRGMAGREPVREEIEKHFATKTPNFRCAAYEDFRVMLEKEKAIRIIELQKEREIRIVELQKMDVELQKRDVELEKERELRTSDVDTLKVEVEFAYSFIYHHHC